MTTGEAASRRTPPSRKWRDAWALAIALGSHALLALVGRYASGGAARHLEQSAELQIELIDADVRVPASGGPAIDQTARAEPVARAALPSLRAAIPERGLPGATLGAVTAELPAASPVEAAPGPLAPVPSVVPAPIDLGLQGGILRGALLDPRFDAREPARPSIGLLTEGLAQADAAKGLSRSSAAVSAGYQAASALAPPVGIALFEVRADAGGAVVSVNVISEGPDQAMWVQVAEAMRRDLARRKLRVPPGAGGLVARLRIERGQHADDPAAMKRLQRGPAMGQEAPPPRQAADESTQGGLHRGFAPTLGVFSTEKKARATRVVVVSERVL